ncbi:MAG TPA: hypothetical protein EYN67_13810 [Flavobacteriales bacterium]|nr:hypothetical protein [Flavobacteriales bacterium]
MAFKGTQFTSRNLDDLRTDIETLLEAYGERVGGVKFKMGKIKYSAESATISLEANLPDSTGKVITAEMKAYNVYAQMDGINIALGGFANSRTLGRVKMDGYKPRNTKYPYIVTQVSTGKSYKMPLSNVRQLVAE